MKKYFALVISAATVLTCLTACGTKTKGGEVVTDRANNPVAVITEESGGVKRDSNGNAIVLVTDANGKNRMDKDGNYVTEAVTIEHVLRMGDVVEMQSFSMSIPDGWSYEETSFNDVTLKNSKGDSISIKGTKGKTASDLLAEEKFLEAIDKSFPDSEKTNSSVEIKGKSFPIVARFVPKDVEGGSTYVGYIFFDNGDTGYTCMMMGRHNVGEDIDDIVKVLDTIQYR